MNIIANPLDYLIKLCEEAVTTGKWKLDKFTVCNAKDELKRLRNKVSDLVSDCQLAHEAAIHEMNRELNFTNVAWAKINSRGDLFDPRLIFNQYDGIATIPLYANKEEMRKALEKIKK